MAAIVFGNVSMLTIKTQRQPASQRIQLHFLNHCGQPSSHFIPSICVEAIL